MKNKSITVMIADDHNIFRTGLKKIISSFKNIIVVGEAQNGRELVDRALTLSPDIIFTDIDMPVMNGIQATRELCSLRANCRILALSIHNRPEPLMNMLDAGAMGYLLKTADTKEIADAIFTAAKQTPYFCRETGKKLDRLIIDDKKNTRPDIYFSLRELDVMQLICREYTSKAIANILKVSRRTVEGHRTRIMDKTGAKSIAGIIIYAYENGIYKSER